MRVEPKVPQETSYDLIKTLKEITNQVNGLTEGRMSFRHSASTSFPTTGTYANGDVIFNSAPSELGSASSKYVITQWICTVSGTPGTWVACRSLTGN